MLSMFLSGCTNLKFAAVNVPQYWFDGEIITDIAYGDLERQKLDIYIPKSPKDSEQQALPVVVFFHGGRWTFGDKSQYKFVGMSLAKLGYIVVMPNTRLYPDVKFPKFVEDGAKALAWSLDNIAKYGASSDIFVSGHSSGAHIGSLALANEDYLAKYNKTPQQFNAFAGLAGPYDFVPNEDDLKAMFGPPSNYANFVVTNFIDGSEPPMMLMWSADDKIVYERNLKYLEKGIKAQNGRVESIIYPNGGHTGVVSAFSWVNPASLPVEQDMHAFFSKFIED